MSTDPAPAPAPDPAPAPAPDPAPAPAPQRAWMDGLSDELKGDASLQRFDDVPALANSYLELRKSMGSRIALPAEDAGEEAWGDVWNKLGRPETAEGYTFSEGVDEGAAAEFAPLAHQLGLTAKQAAAIAQFDVDRVAAAAAQVSAESKADLDRLKVEMGSDYAPQLDAANKLWRSMFGEEAGNLADEADEAVGSAALVRGMMKLASHVGELPFADSGEDGVVNGVKDSEAEARLTALQKDKGWREKLNAGDVTVKAEYDRLLDQAKRHAVRTA